MKSLINGFCTAFSMYSIVPVPFMAWNKKTMKYALCFFPLIGVVIGALIYALNYICVLFNVSPLLFSAIMIAVPLLISGAIHLDGFIDTCDAKYSRQETDKKLEILKDPHVGAFGVIMCVSYFVIQLGLFGQFFNNTKHILFICLGFILSRCMSALSIVTFKTAKNTGLAHIFSDNADKKAVATTMRVILLLIYLLMLWINFWIGSIIILSSIAYFFIYKRMCYKEFGGITGDLAGFFLQILEIIILAIATFGVGL